MKEPTIVPEDHCQVVLSPGADVDQDAGSAGGAKAKHQLLLGHVGLNGNPDLWQGLSILRRRGFTLQHKVVSHQSPRLKVSAHICSKHTRTKKKDQIS